MFDRRGLHLVIVTVFFMQIWYNLEKGDLLSSTLCFLLMRNGSSRMRTLETAVLV